MKKLIKRIKKICVQPSTLYIRLFLYLYQLASAFVSSSPVLKLLHYTGVQVPRGALLHGPSGCGKTVIAQAIGRRLQGHAAFITLDAAQLWSK